MGKKFARTVWQGMGIIIPIAVILWVINNPMKLAALLILITLSACATPPRASVRTSADPDMVVIEARATLDDALVAQQATRQAMENQQATADVMARITVSETAVAKTATVAWRVTDEARVAATATNHAQTIQEIKEQAAGTRFAAETVATIQSIAIETKMDANSADRAEWARVAWVVVSIILVLGIGSGLAAIAWREAWTIRDADGTIVGYRGDIFLPENEPTIIDQPQQPVPDPRPFAVRHRGGFVQQVDDIRAPYDLTGRDGSHVHQFSGRVLDDMQTNIETGDRGFRRDSSVNKLGMVALASVNANLYQKLLDAMKVNGFVEREGSGHRWTAHGMATVLGIGSTNNLTDNLE